jgi:dUTP pyrophosphatase
MEIKILDNGVTIPEYATNGSAGFDIASTHNILIPAGGTALIRTGLYLEIPHGYELQIRPRSGLALKHSISVLNSPGTIDSDYRSEIGVILINHGKESYKVNIGDRIAQGVINKVYRAKFIKMEKLSTTDREGGYGSTGK